MDLRGPQHQAAPQREAGRRPPVRPALEGHDAVTVQQHLQQHGRQAGGSKNQTSQGWMTGQPKCLVVRRLVIGWVRAAVG